MLSTPFEFQIVFTKNPCITLNLRRLCFHRRSFPGQQCFYLYDVRLTIITAPSPHLDGRRFPDAYVRRDHFYPR